MCEKEQRKSKALVIVMLIREKARVGSMEQTGKASNHSLPHKFALNTLSYTADFLIKIVSKNFYYKVISLLSILTRDV